MCSTGGGAPVKALFELQDRYGLFLFFDEAHDTSSIGHRGRGVVLEERPDSANGPSSLRR